jgi:hypothetical protein
MKCSLCNLTYVGVSHTRPSGKPEFYYRCNGNQGARGLYGAHGERCPAKAIRGAELEQIIWGDVEEFLRKPSVVIERLQARMQADAGDATKNRDRLRRLRGLLEAKAEDRNRVVTLHRRGRLNETDLDKHLDTIDQECAGLASQIAELEAKAGGSDSNGAVLEGAEALLTRLRRRLDQPLNFERRRQLVELLVGGIRVETIRNGGKRENIVTVTYKFPSAVVKCTDRGSWPTPA